MRNLCSTVKWTEKYMERDSSHTGSNGVRLLMVVHQTNPVGIKLFLYVNNFLVWGATNLLPVPQLILKPRNEM